MSYTKMILTVLFTSLTFISPFVHAHADTATFIPLNSQDQWIELQFNNIPANKVMYTEKGLDIMVSGSASPLIHRLNGQQKVTRIKVDAQVMGQLNLRQDVQQGSKNADDFTFRLGLVESGKKRLYPWQKPFTAKWIKQLFALAPENSGIKKIVFLNVPQNSDISGIEREHPTSDLIREVILTPATEGGKISIDHTLTSPINTLAIWISSDGDDTDSHYQILINSITLLVTPT